MTKPLLSEKDVKEIFDAFAKAEESPTDSIYKGLAGASGLSEDEMKTMYSEAWNNVPRSVPFAFYKG